MTKKDQIWVYIELWIELQFRLFIRVCHYLFLYLGFPCAGAILFKPLPYNAFSSIFTPIASIFRPVHPCVNSNLFNTAISRPLITNGSVDDAGNKYLPGHNDAIRKSNSCMPDSMLQLNAIYLFYMNLLLLPIHEGIYTVNDRCSLCCD